MQAFISFPVENTLLYLNNHSFAYLLKYISLFKNSVKVKLNTFSCVSCRMVAENDTEVLFEEGRQNSSERHVEAPKES